MERKRSIMEIREKSWENTSKYLDLKYGCKVVETMWYHEPYRKQIIPHEDWGNTRFDSWVADYIKLVND